MQFQGMTLRNLIVSSFSQIFNFRTVQWGRFSTDRVFSTLKTNTSRFPPELFKANKKITQMIQSGKLQDARMLFDNLPQRNTVTWNSMLTGYVQNRDIARAQKLFDEMPERDIISWNLMISGYMSCYRKGCVDEGRLLFDEMPARDSVSWNTVISGYAKNGRMDDALRLFNSIPEKNVVSWNAMITGFLNNGDVVSATYLFKRMPKRDAASLSAIMSGLIQNNELDEAANVLIGYEEIGDEKKDLVHAYNTLIAGYGQKGRVDDARFLFNLIPLCSSKENGRRAGFEKNVVSWNSMIMCYVKAGDMTRAKDLFDQMEELDTFTWNTMISGYVHVSAMEEATDLFSKMPAPDALSWNSIISGFAQLGKMKFALDFFERMPNKNKVSWNTIIAGFEKNADYKEAIDYFVQMQSVGEKPDRFTLSSLLSVCAESVAHKLGIQIHQLVTKFVIPDVPLNNALVTMYAKCGAIFEAKKIFNKIKFQKNVISWNAMIGGYASHGFAKEAIELFESMKLLKVRPTYITFISVLNACAHAGLVEQGKSYFKSMVQDFGIERRVEHYASLVDVIGRHGQVDEAMYIINWMTIQPDKAVWGALLGACRVHNNVEYARVAAEALMRLEPESSGPYVLLYNMYADAGRWNDADEIRILMERNNIKKERAYSSVNSSYP